MVMKRTIEQTIINESIRRMEEEAEEEIRQDRVSMLTDAPEFVKDIVRPMAAFMIALSKIALLSGWN